MEQRKSTPWGQSQGSVELAEGIVSYHTSSHGGIWLSKKRQKQLAYSDNFLKNPAWWEEDCDWAVPYVFFAEDIRKHGNAYKFDENLTAALKTIEHYHPDFHNAYMGLSDIPGYDEDEENGWVGPRIA